MSKSRAAAGRAPRVAALLAAALLAACTPRPDAPYPSAAQVLPDSGPLPLAMVKRMLLVDGARAGGRVVAVGDRGYIVLSDDEGASWRRASSPVAPLLTAVDFLDAKHGWAVGHDSVILATADGGQTWTQRFSAPSEERPLLDVLFLDATRGIAVGAYGAYYETGDGGRTWAARKIIAEDRHFNGILRLPSRASVGGLDSRRLMIVGEEGTILVSDDDGGTWRKLASPYKGSLFGGVVASDGAVVVFGLRGRIYRSADAGESWTQVDNASTATLMGGARFPDGAIVLAGAAGIVLVSRDDGRSFVPLATGSARLFSKAIPDGTGEALLLGEGGARAVALPSLGKAQAR